MPDRPVAAPLHAPPATELTYVQAVNAGPQWALVPSGTTIAAAVRRLVGA